jgi:hypothetical protein
MGKLQAHFIDTADRYGERHKPELRPNLDAFQNVSTINATTPLGIGVEHLVIYHNILDFKRVMVRDFLALQDDVGSMVTGVVSSTTKPAASARPSVTLHTM